LALVAVFALLAAACGGGGGGDDGDGGGAQSPGVKDDATPQPGGTLTFGLESETTGGFCTAESQLAASGIAVAQAIYDQLAVDNENYEPQPYLAESIEPSPDFLTWTITLRDGITFHDGTPLTADVVKLNMDLWAGDPDAVAATGRSPLLFPLIFGNIDTISVSDPLTVVVTMDVPWIAFDSYLSSGRFVIAAAAQLNSENCSEDMIGTGPFKLDKWTRNQQMELSKNDSYWRTDADGVQLPYLDKLVFKPIAGGTNRFQALEAGSIDSGQFSTVTVFQDIEDQPDKFSLVLEQPGHREVGYGLTNVSKPPLDDLETRKHIAMAIDRDAINDISNNGGFDIAEQPFDSDVIGFVDGLVLTDYDPDTAAEFFAGKNVAINLSYAIDPNTKAVAEDVQRQLGDVGVDVSIDEKDQSTLINQALTGDFNVLLWRNHPGGDPDQQYVWWHSTMPSNFGRINDPEMDSLLDQGRSETDPDARVKIYEQISERFASEGYNLWNWYTQWGFGATNNVHQLGYYTLPDGSVGSGLNWGWTLWPEVWVEQ
jgi:peptide/nickel transport system substrate-binding protein